MTCDVIEMCLVQYTISHYVSSKATSFPQVIRYGIVVKVSYPVISTRDGVCNAHIHAHGL